MRMARRAPLYPVTAVEARDRFDELMHRAAADEPVVVEDRGSPSVVIVSLARYEQLLRDARLARFDRVTHAAGAAAEQAGLTEEQLEGEMEAIRSQHHQRAYG